MISFTGEGRVSSGAIATPISSGSRLLGHRLLNPNSPPGAGIGSISGWPATGGSNHWLSGLVLGAVTAVLSGGSNGPYRDLTPTNEASLCRLLAARFLRRHNIHSISPNANAAAAATPPTAMPATARLVSRGLLLGCVTIGNVDAGVAVDEKVRDADVGVG